MPDTPTKTPVEYERVDNIVTLTLNRPEKLNAFNDELVGALADALRRFDVDAEACVAIIRGRGRAFSSGATCISVSCASARNSRRWAVLRAGAPTPSTC